MIFSPLVHLPFIITYCLIEQLIWWLSFSFKTHWSNEKKNFLFKWKDAYVSRKISSRKGTQPNTVWQTKWKHKNTWMHVTWGKNKPNTVWQTKWKHKNTWMHVTWGYEIKITGKKIILLMPSVHIKYVGNLIHYSQLWTK